MHTVSWYTGFAFPQKSSVFLLSLISVLSGCSGQNDPMKFKGITYCSESNPSTFNPQLDTSSTTSDASAHQIYSRLIEFNAADGMIQPSLASSWLVSDDKLTYTFQLERNVSFHTTDYFSPTRYFNADDVIFSIDRWRDKHHPYHNISGGVYPYFESLGLDKTIKEVKRINGYRVEISLYQPDSSFLANLATDFALILSEEYASQLMAIGSPSDLDTNPIGTGPFKFKSYRKNHYIRYQRHPEYFGKTTQTDNLIFDITTSSSLRIAKLITGECDAIAFPSHSDLEAVRQKPNLTLSEKPGLNVGFWAFNTSKAPFNNPKVRKALALAIDKTAILEAVYFGQASRAKGLLPSDSWAYQSNSPEMGYNPVAARKMLDEVGVPSGFVMDIWAMPVARSYNPNAMKMAELMQSYLRAVDITVNIVSYDWSRFRDNLTLGLHDSVLIGWSADNGDPDNFYRPLLSCAAIPSGTNRAMWCNPEYDNLIYSALDSTDIDERTLIYHQANALLFEEMPLMPIAHAFQYQASNNNIMGLEINPYGGIRFAGVVQTK